MADVIHPKCGKRFPSGNRAGHCSACCETFIGNTAFESHRIGEHGTPNRRCKDLFDGIDGFWHDDRGFWHHGERLTDEQKEQMWGAKA